MNSQEKFKRWGGRCLLHFCDYLPQAKPLFRKLGLRTKKEWFGGRVVRVQLPGGRSFKLASVSENYLSFEIFWRGTQYYEPITSLVLGIWWARATPSLMSAPTWGSIRCFCPALNRSATSSPLNPIRKTAACSGPTSP